MTLPPRIRTMDIPCPARLAAAAAAASRQSHPSAPPRHLTHATLTAFLHTLLPAAPTHLPLIYHTPRTHHIPITRIVLSITATPGIYPLLHPGTALFLHRPWDLDRRRMKPSTLVLTSHQRLDELLTTGYNMPLLQRLGVQETMAPIVGYKGDPERKIGLVARLAGKGVSLGDWIDRIHEEFHGLESVTRPTSEEQDTYPAPRYIACMNAFEPAVIDRALAAAQSLSPDQRIDPQQIIYLTGQPRPLGTTYAAERRIPCLFTGHRRAEVWAVNYLAGMLSEGFDGVEVLVVDEEWEEEDMQRRKREARIERGGARGA